MKNLFAFILVFLTLMTWSQTGGNIRLLGSSPSGTSGTPVVTTQAATTITAPIVTTPTPPPNAIKFFYDTAGNQTRREFIYLAAGNYRGAAPNIILPKVPDNKLTVSDLHEDVSYFPNPVESELFVKWQIIDNDFVKKIELYSFSGQMLNIFEVPQSATEITVDFRSYPRAYYNLLLVYNSGKVKDLKIIKK